MEFQFNGSLTSRDRKKYTSLTFTVPIGAEQIDIHFEYSPKRVGNLSNLLTIGISDSVSDRGTAHRGQPVQDIVISAEEATPGFLAGTLTPGTWHVSLDAHWIADDTILNYELQIVVTTESSHEGRRWYKGDLHGHTLHSDGRWDVDGLLGFAREQKLDFVTLTDHNTVAGLREMDGKSSDALLTMGGFELTTFHGHALALGIREMLDWRTRPERTITQIKSEIESLGGLFIIAHPKAPGDGYCTGCRWEYWEMMPATAVAVEVWNEEWDSISNNEAAVQLWYQWLNQGFHIYATVGTDIHGPRDEAFGFNFVYAEDRNEIAILDAVRQGHHYLSSGPRIELTGESAQGHQVMMGDSLKGESYTIKAVWDNCQAGDTVRLIADGQVIDELDAQAVHQKTWELSDKLWCVIEIRNAQHHMRALTNPIFME